MAAAVANPGAKPGRSWSGRLTCGSVAELPAVGSFLGSLAADERTALGEIGHARSYRRGERMILEGDQNDITYLVLEGRVRVFTGTPEGTEVTLCVRGPGDLIGEMGAIRVVAARPTSSP